MNSTEPPKTCPDDGLYSRPSGVWSRTKLAFLDEFGPVALQATLGARQPKRSAVYVDLFAGPGVCSEGSEFFYGSPLRAVTLRTTQGFAFTDAYLVNRDPAQYNALEHRLDALDRAGALAIPRHRIRNLLGDTNHLVHAILDAIDPWAYVFVFADPTKPNHLDWTTIEALRRYRGHKSVDLYMLFPSSALTRMLCYDLEIVEINAPALRRFYGDDSWRSCLPHRLNEERRIEFSRELLGTYLNRLRPQLWKRADLAFDVRQRRGQRIYQMLFATDHDAGDRISKWAAARARPRDQLGFDFG